MAFPDTGNELHKLIEPVDNKEKYRETMEFIDNVLRPQAMRAFDMTNDATSARSTKNAADAR